MTPATENRVEEPADRTSGDWPSVGRRPLLKAVSAGAALSMGSSVVTADDAEVDEGLVDQAEGFEAEVVAPHATFPDDVAASFGVAYQDGDTELAFVPDASTVVIVRARFEPGGTSGWHTDVGPALLSVVEGEVDVGFEEGCATQTYAAGEAILITGRGADIVENASDTEPAMTYVIFLGVPDGESPTNPVEPPDC
ncbi:hypothetical protein [Haladaptatus sp. NG-SE-30]